MAFQHAVQRIGPGLAHIRHNQQHELQHRIVDQRRSVTVAAFNQVMTEPEGQRRQHLLNQRRAQAPVEIDHILFFKLAEHILDRLAFHREDLAEPAGQTRIAFHHVADIAIEEPEIINLFEDDIDKDPIVLDRGHRAMAAAKDDLHLFLEAIKQRLDDRFLALEVIIEIARRHIERIGDINSRLLGFAFRIEKRQTDIKNTIACFHRFGFAYGLKGLFRVYI